MFREIILIYYLHYNDNIVRKSRLVENYNQCEFINYLFALCRDYKTT